MNAIIKALSEQAAKAMKDGEIFQVNSSAFDSEADVRRFITHTTNLLGANIRAHAHAGMLTVYLDDGSPVGNSVTVATVER